MMRKSQQLMLPDEAATEALGAALARLDPPCRSIFLHGELGAGKTTLVRGLLRAMGHGGPVRSPTYALIESYALDGRPVHHLDLYRLSDPEELDYLGIRDLAADDAMLVIEWAERGAGLLGEADLEIVLEYAGVQRAARLTVADTAPCTSPCPWLDQIRTALSPL